MGKRKSVSRFFRWIKSDLPDCDPNPVLLLNVAAINAPQSSKQQQHQQHQNQPQRPHTTILVDSNSYYDELEHNDLIDKRKSLDILENRKVHFPFNENDNLNFVRHYNNNNNNNSNSIKNHFEDYNLRESIKIGQINSATPTNRATSGQERNFDKNSNENPNDKQQNFQQPPTPTTFTTSFEINKNNKIYNRKEYLTKKNSFDLKIKENKSSTSSTSQAAVHQQQPKLSKAAVATTTTPKILITCLKNSSDKFIENICVVNDEDEHRKKNITLKKTNNCRIYNFIPRCTRRNDSTEPESSISEETNNNIDIKKKFNSNNLTKNNSLIMDRSVDSIGSCSLDVDADSTDFSDTSGSLNLVTPSSGKDFPREFTSRIQERCQIPPQILLSPKQNQQLIQQTTTILDPNSGKITTILSSPLINETNEIKKPSYLNLACCVNGYSNLTTYDSKLRQNINKSREVSPIRPIIHTLQYNRDNTGNNYLVVPIPVPAKLEQNLNNKMETNHHSHKSFMSTEKRLFTSQMLNNENSIGKDTVDDVGYKKSSIVVETPTKSFIQQRVERLYGPGALAQGFYTNKRLSSDGNGNINNNNLNDNILSEKYLLNNGKKNDNNYLIKTFNLNLNDENEENLKKNQNNEPNNVQSLPVLRHLRPEFRAQLPISPKRTTTTTTTTSVKSLNNEFTTMSLNNKQIITTTTTQTLINKSKINGLAEDNNERFNDNTATKITEIKILNDDDKNEKNKLSQKINGEADGYNHQQNKNSEEISINNDKMKIINNKMEQNTNNKILITDLSNCENEININNKTLNDKNTEIEEKDGNYFLKILKRERDRLFAMADETEKEMELLIESNSVSEEILGYLRSFSGKARLLATQKIKQFEGLCHKNLSVTPSDDFPTTIEDLEGFWDMVMLQVNHVDSLFKEIESWKANNWKKPSIEKPAPPQGSKLIKRPMAVKGNSTQITNGTNSGTKHQKSTTAAATQSTLSLAAQKREAQREAQRKAMAELRRKNKMEQQKEQQNGVEIFIAGGNS